MAVDTPARIAILGAGPIGLEAALYARFLGYDVDLYERSQPGANVLRWGHLKMFSPFGMNASSLGLAALAAQDSNYHSPPADALLTGRQWWDHYLRPIAESDLIADSLQCQTTVVAVGKSGLLKSEFVGQSERDDAIFRILIRDQVGNEFARFADVVIDTTGVCGNPNWIGDGGIPARGETTLQSRIVYEVPDILDRDRAQYENVHTVVIGSGYSAATTIGLLDRLRQETPRTSMTWITRRTPTQEPIPRIPADPFLERDRVGQEANRLARVTTDRFQYLPDQTVTRVDQFDSDGPFELELQSRSDGGESKITCDRIIANVGYRPDSSIYSELQIHECYVFEGPINLGSSGTKNSGTGPQPTSGPAALLNPEPHFYVLGSKSYGRRSHFLYRTGLDQIRDLFTIIGDRETLDLYTGAKQLPR